MYNFINFVMNLKIMRIKQVEKDLEELVTILTEYIPDLREVRLFGSYENGCWDPGMSDIDIYILIDSKSASKYPIKEIRSRLTGKYKGWFDLVIRTPAHHKFHQHYDGERGNFGENINCGRLLYKRKRWGNYLSFLKI